MIRTKKLVKAYHKRRVVDEISIEMHPGEIVGLLGPNGAGKTTTFYMIVGLIKPESGAHPLYTPDPAHAPPRVRPGGGRGGRGVGRRVRVTMATEASNKAHLIGQHRRVLGGQQDVIEGQGQGDIGHGHSTPRSLSGGGHPCASPLANPGEDLGQKSR